MCEVQGLDRLPGTLLEGMDDTLWSQHTKELQERFQAQDEGAALGFNAFCAKFADGTLTTQAMGTYQANKGEPSPKKLKATPVMLEGTAPGSGGTRFAHGRPVPGLKFGGPGGKCKDDSVQAPLGQVFLGLNLARKHERGHPDTVTRQTAFDFNEIIDRDYKYLCKTNDDGWLVGGGEGRAGYKIPAVDSAHVTVMDVGTFEDKFGGMSAEALISVIESKVLIPEMKVVPICVELNPDTPPEIELRFHYIPAAEGQPVEEGLNWQLKFLQNQLFEHVKFPGRHGGDHYHVSMVRKAEFRSAAALAGYAEKCDTALKKWQAKGPQTGGEFCLWRNRNEVVHSFKPNFLPPYNTPEKRALIAKVLANPHGAEQCGF